MPNTSRIVLLSLLAAAPLLWGCQRRSVQPVPPTSGTPAAASTTATPEVPEAVRPLLGEYEADGRSLVVTFEDGSLRGKAGNRAPVALVHRSGTTYDLQDAGNVTATFIFDANGGVMGLTVRETVGTQSRERTYRKIP